MNLMEDIKNFDLVIVPYENQENQGIKYVKSQVSDKNIETAAIIIGPEGGFEEEEIEALKDIGAFIVTLGPRILRTETAGFVALSLIMYELGDLGGNVKMKVALYTLGCRVNSYESEAMAEKFIKEGYEVVSFDEFSDVYVINTCTVTNMGDKKSRQMIGRARRHNPDAIIAVVGCYSQIASDEIAQIEGVDVVLGSRNKGDIVYWVNRAREERKQVVEVKDVLKDKKFEELAINEYQDKTRAFLKIQDGCNRFCTYCLIPFARGAVCSKEPRANIKGSKRTK